MVLKSTFIIGGVREKTGTAPFFPAGKMGRCPGFFPGHRREEINGFLSLFPKPVDLLHPLKKFAEIQWSFQMHHKHPTLRAVTPPAVFHCGLTILFGMEKTVLIMLLRNTKIMKDLLDSQLGPILHISSRLLGHIAGRNCAPSFGIFENGFVVPSFCKVR